MLELSPIVLSFKLAFLTTLILFFIAIPISFYLSNSKGSWKAFLESSISLPLVLPPTVLGFYLLMAFSPENAIVSFIEDHIGIRLLFSFEGLVIASVIYSLPFMVHPIQAGLNNLPKHYSEASFMMGKGKWYTLRKVLLPNIKPALLSGIVLSFAHTVGEFGLVLMIGGNIKDETRVASIAVYDYVEALDYGSAHLYSLILFGITFLILFLLYRINNSYSNRFWI